MFLICVNVLKKFVREAIFQTVKMLSQLIKIILKKSFFFDDTAQIKKDEINVTISI
jgi:hypothetical protein